MTLETRKSKLHIVCNIANSINHYNPAVITKCQHRKTNQRTTACRNDETWIRSSDGQITNQITNEILKSQIIFTKTCNF